MTSSKTYCMSIVFCTNCRKSRNYEYCTVALYIISRTRHYMHAKILYNFTSENVEESRRSMPLWRTQIRSSPLKTHNSRIRPIHLLPTSRRDVDKSVVRGKRFRSFFALRRLSECRCIKMTNRIGRVLFNLVFDMKILLFIALARVISFLRVE
jgi:hypothetical protein